MASLAQLQADATAWLKRKDITPQLPSWVKMVETDISEQLRARCLVRRATQPIDAAFITMPTGWLAVESIKSDCCGALLTLEDHFTGPLPGNCSACGGPRAVTGFRYVGDCIEFLPHPSIPDPLPAGWKPRSVDMAWYNAPTPLINPQDTNAVLENLYSVYLFGLVRYGAMYELDDDRAGQMENAFGGAIAAANLWKMASDYTGAPLRAVVRGF